MNFANWALGQLLSYGMWPSLLMAAIVFAAAYRWRLAGILIGHYLVAMLVVYLDVTWLQSAMRSPHWNGEPDQGLLFLMGIMLRIVLVNVALLPVSISAMLLSYWRGRRR